MKVILSLLVYLAAFGANAQVLLGAKGGLSISSVNGIGSASKIYNWEKGYHGGIYIHSYIGSNLFFQPELIYNARGYQLTKTYSTNKAISGDTTRLYQQTSLSYLEIPVLAKIQWGKLFFEAGPQFGFLMSAESKDVHVLKINGEETKINSSHDLRSVVEPVDIGFIAGLGLQMDSGLGVNLRYNQGFREVVRRVNWQKNVQFQASASYIFGYNKFLKSKSDNPIVSESEGVEYYDSVKAKKKKNKGYRILINQNVQRVSIIKMGESLKSEVRFVFNSVGYTPSNIVMSGTSGNEEQTTLFTGFRDVQTPFKGTIRYNVQSSIGEGAVESNLEFEILEPGIWRVNILTQ